MIKRKAMMCFLIVMTCMIMALPAYAAPSEQNAQLETATSENIIRYTDIKNNSAPGQNVSENQDGTEATVNCDGAEVTSFAKKFLGNRYRYSGTSLTNGVDCSGFTMAVYNHFGISLPHSSKSQRYVGKSVGSLDEAQAGDLICYSGHVALYLGDGQIIHAQSAKTGIIISDATYNRILAIRRVI